MRFNSTIALSVALSMALAALGGCAKRDDRGPTDPAQQAARFTRMIDERRYDDVIQLLESDPEGRRVHAGLLAMAYLGRSGFEPLRFAEGVVAAQPEAPADLEKLVPDCDRRALQKFDQVPTRCLLKRIWMSLPRTDRADFNSAQELFRSAYPNPSTTAADMNTIIAIAETASTLDRLRALIEKFLEISGKELSQISESDVMGLLTDAKDIEADGEQALARARYSVPILSRLITGLDRQSVMVRGSDRAMSWGEETAIPAVQRFTVQASAHTPEGAREIARKAIAAFGVGL